METVVGNHRIEWIDLCKGLAMILVVVGHTFRNDVVVKLIYSFHMPLFFILSGYTIPQVNTGALTWSAKFKKEALKCYIPIFVIICFETVVRIKFLGKDPFEQLILLIKSFAWGNDYSLNCNYKLVGYLWFVIALFWAKWIYRLISSKGRLFCVGTICLLCIVSLFFLGKIILPHNFDNLFICVFYLEVGNLLKRLKLFDENGPLFWGGFIVLFLIWLCVGLKYPFMLDINHREYDAVIVMNSILGSILFMRLCKSIVNYFAFRRVVWLGRHTLPLLYIHQIDSCLGIFLKLSEKLKNVDISFLFLLRMLVYVVLLILVVNFKKFIDKNIDNEFSGAH